MPAIGYYFIIANIFTEFSSEPTIPDTKTFASPIYRSESKMSRALHQDIWNYIAQLSPQQDCVICITDLDGRIATFYTQEDALTYLRKIPPVRLRGASCNLIDNKTQDQTTIEWQKFSRRII